MGKRFESAKLTTDTKTWQLTQLTWNECVTLLVTHSYSTLSFRWTVHFSFCSLPCARVHLWWGVQRNPRREGQSNDQVRKKSQLKYPITSPTKILKRLLKVVVSPEHKVLVSSIDGCWSLGYFRVAPSFCFKARLSAKLLVWLIFGSGLLHKISRSHLKWPWA